MTLFHPLGEDIVGRYNSICNWSKSYLRGWELAINESLTRDPWLKLSVKWMSVWMSKQIICWKQMNECVREFVKSVLEWKKMRKSVPPPLKKIKQNKTMNDVVCVGGKERICMDMLNDWKKLCINGCVFVCVNENRNELFSLCVCVCVSIHRNAYLHTHIYIYVYIYISDADSFSL